MTSIIIIESYRICLILLFLILLMFLFHHTIGVWRASCLMFLFPHTMGVWRASCLIFLFPWELDAVFVSSHCGSLTRFICIAHIPIGVYEMMFPVATSFNEINEFGACVSLLFVGKLVMVYKKLKSSIKTLIHRLPG